MSTPAQVGGFSLGLRLTDAKNTAEYMRDAIAAEVNLDKSVGAIYKRPRRRRVILVAGTGRIWKPEQP